MIAIAVAFAILSGLAFFFGVIVPGIILALFTLRVLDVALGGPQARARKVCPDCAEQVKAAARVCRYCGHRFQSHLPR